MIIVLYGCISFLVGLHYKVQNKHEKTVIREKKKSFTLLLEYFWKYKVNRNQALRAWV
jgi:hypothetical protein